MKKLKICLCFLCLLHFRAVGTPQDSGATFFMEPKSIKGFEKYLIYPDGKMWSLSKKCFMRPSLTLDGYPHSHLTTATGRRSITFHRLIAIAFVPNPNNYKEVNHIDGNKQNNHYTNLEWCTRSHNVKQTYALGFRRQDGKFNGNYKDGRYARRKAEGFPL